MTVAALERMGQKQRIGIVIAKIRTQIPDNPHCNLMFAVIKQAFRDLTSKRDRYDAARYLRGDIPHAQACGINAAWIHRLMKAVKIDLTN